MTWLYAAIDGLLLAGPFALWGVALVYGRRLGSILGIAHGHFAVLGLVLVSVIGPRSIAGAIIGSLVFVPLIFLLGYGLNVALELRPEVREQHGELGALALVAAVAFAASGLAQWVVGDDGLGNLSDRLDAAVLSLGDGTILRAHLAALVLSLVAIGLLVFVSNSTSIGSRLRAAAEDPESFDRLGLSSMRARAAGSGLVFGLTALGGVLYGLTSKSPSATDGPLALVSGFEAVVIGGIASLWGPIGGGVALGLTRSLGNEFVSGWGMVASHVLALAMLVYRLRGRASLWTLDGE